MSELVQITTLRNIEYLDIYTQKMKNQSVFNVVNMWCELMNCKWLSEWVSMSVVLEVDNVAELVQLLAILGEILR